MLMEGLKYTSFAALSRAVCGIRGKTLIINFPGSEKAVKECFEAISNLIPHAIQLICDEKEKNEKKHGEIQKIPEVAKRAGEKQQKNHDNKTNKEKFHKNQREIQKTQNKPQSAQKPPQKPPVTSKKPSVPVSELEELLKAQGIDFGREEQPVGPTKSEVEGFQEIINNLKPTPMTELVVDEVVKPMNVPKHVCPHKTGNLADKSDRNSPFPMISVKDALQLILSNIPCPKTPRTFLSPMDCPPFRASIKDGYAMKSSNKSKVLKVIGYVNAGDRIVKGDFKDNECYKINTGAPIPYYADCVVQVEDTKLIRQNADSSETEIELTGDFPSENLDIREIGSDLAKNQLLFTTTGPLDVPQKTLLASVGLTASQITPKIAIISTGDELADPTAGELQEGQIFDSNSTMLKLLCEKFGFGVKMMRIAGDDYESLKEVVEEVTEGCDVVVSSGGVSMGDKDFVKKVLVDLGFDIKFGRVNMKPGKPMTFATNQSTSKTFFALPGNPVSAFVTFHLFVLPALRFMTGYKPEKCLLPTINVHLQDKSYNLDPRPEFARAKVTFDSKSGKFHAKITDNQISSRIASLIDADIFVQLPGAAEVDGGVIKEGAELQAKIIDQFFVSKIY